MANLYNSQNAQPLHRPTCFASDDIYIAVMGVTGAGKSTFISQCCQDDGIGIGHSLRSETKDVQVFTFAHDGKWIHLIDTPGFDDTYRTDSDVLQDLAYWLTTSYKDMNIRLTGIVYLHRITDPRMTGNALKNLRTFRKLCGKQSMSSVVLATTMWEQVKPSDGNIREADLAGTPEFWGDMLKEDSMMVRHMNNHNSAINIIMCLVQKRTTTTLEIQTEMVDLQRSLNETKAGQEVESELLKQRQVFERRLQRVEDEMQEALASNDRQHMEEVAKDRARLQKMIEVVEKGSQNLRIDLEKLIRERELQHQREKEELDAQLRRQQEELKRKDAEFAAWRAQQEREDQQRERQREAAQAELQAAYDRINQGGHPNATSMLNAATQRWQQQQQTAQWEQERVRREAEERQRLLMEQSQQLQSTLNQRVKASQANIAAWTQYYSQQQQQQQTQQTQQFLSGVMGSQFNYQQQLNQAMFGMPMAGASTWGTAASTAANGAAMLGACNVM